MNKKNLDPIAHMLIKTGVALQIGALLLGLIWYVLWGADIAENTALVGVIGAALLVSLMWAAKWCAALSRLKSPEVFWNALWPFFAVAIFFFIVVKVLILLPGMSWDGLDFWFPRTASLHSMEDVGSVASVMAARHPPTLPSFGAFLISCAEFLGHSSSTYIRIGSVVPILSLAAVLLGFATARKLHPFACVVLIVTCLFSPLLENHIFLFGYADGWVASTIVTMSVSLIYFWEKRGYVWGLLAAVSIIELALLKNVGPLLSIYLVGALLITKRLGVFAAFLMVGILAAAVEVSPSPQAYSFFNAGINKNTVTLSKEVCSAADVNQPFFVKYYYNLSANEIRGLHSIEKDRTRFEKYDDIRPLTPTPRTGCSVDLPFRTDRSGLSLLQVGQLESADRALWAVFLVPDAESYVLPLLNLTVQKKADLIVAGINSRTYLLKLASGREVLSNAVTALVRNSSFGVWPLILGISCFSILILDPSPAGRRLVLWAGVLVMMFTLPQLMLNDLFLSSLPGADTRYSRFMLFLAPLAFLSFVRSLSLANKSD